jgi:hypothetical protein
MGLPIPSMRMILREHKNTTFEGNALSLGRMAVLVTYEEVHKLFKEEGLKPHPLDKDTDLLTNIPSMRCGTGKESQYTSDVVFFKMLGFNSLETLDISDYENADHIIDMNEPLTDYLKERFDAIFDFGTTEHIFDTKQAFDNISKMLKPGGVVLHMIGTTNRIGHGFYMFSPCLFYDYYLANKFVETKAYLVESSRGDPSFKKWKLFKYEYNSEMSIEGAFYSSKAVATFFFAKKNNDSTFGVVPAQNQFMKIYDKQTGTNHLPNYKTYLKKYLPSFAISLYYFVSRIRFKIKQKVKPGGLEYLGKI